MVPIGEAGAIYAYVLPVPRPGPNFQQSHFQRLTVHCLLPVGMRKVTEEGQDTRTAMAMSSATSAKFFRGRFPRSSLQPDLCREVIEALWLLFLPTLSPPKEVAVQRHVTDLEMTLSSELLIQHEMTHFPELASALMHCFHLHLYATHTNSKKYATRSKVKMTEWKKPVQTDCFLICYSGYSRVTCVFHWF